MKSITLFLLLAYITKEGISLDCYTCNDCQRGFMNEDDAIQTCEVPFGIDLGVSQCFKEVEDDGDVNRGCTNDAVCIGKEASGYECSESRETDCYICCDEDNCNSASIATVSWTTLLGTLIIMIFVKF